MNILYRHPWLNILAILLITLFFALQLRNLRLDNDVMNFIPEDHPEALAYERTSELFGSRMILGVGIEFKNGSIFEPENISCLSSLTESFQGLENVESVLSLTSADYIDGTPEGMSVTSFIPRDYQGTAGHAAELRSRLWEWDIYEKVLYSADFRAAQILVSFAEDMEAEERENLYYEIKTILDRQTDPPYRYYLAGNPAVTVLVTKNMKTDLKTLIPLVTVVVICALFLAFRRTAGVYIIMLTVVFSTIWAVGAMSFLRIPLSLIATVIPVLMIAVGSAYGIHIISHYYDEISAGTSLPGSTAPAALPSDTSVSDYESHKKIVLDSVHKTGRPVFLAGLTTIIGFGALSTSRVIPIRNFGIFTAFGVLSAVIIALLFIPSLLLVRKKSLKPYPGGQTKISETQPSTMPNHQSSPSASSCRNPKSGIVPTLYRFCSSHTALILLIALSTAAAGIRGTTLIVRDNAVIEYFKIQTDIRKADDFLRRKFAGTEFFDILIKGNYPGALTEPEILKPVDDLALYLERTFHQVARVNSFTDLIKRMNRVMNFPPEQHHTVFQNRESLQHNGQNQENVSGTSSAFPGFFSKPEGSQSFEGGFSVQNSPASDAQYTDHFVSPSEILPSQLQPVDYSQYITYANFLDLLNKSLADQNQSGISAEELVKLINRQLNYRGAAYYEIPFDPDKYKVKEKSELKNLISQYLLLFSGNLDEWSDDPLEPVEIRLNVQLINTGSRETIPVVQAVHTYAGERFPEGYSIETSGSALVKNALTDLLIDAQARSILISISLVFLVITINFRSLMAGLFGVIPIIYSILINFAVMGFFGITLDISTAMVASVALGIGIDYTIHFMSNYHFERLQSENLETVTINTLKSSGKAIIFNAFSVAAGFSVLLFSQFNPLMYLGMLIALTMFTSSLGAVTLLPILFHLFNPAFMAKNNNNKYWRFV